MSCGMDECIKIAQALMPEVKIIITYFFCPFGHFL